MNDVKATTKRFWLDLETTGVDPNENGIHQIAGLIEIDGEIQDELNFQVQPFPDDVIVPKALEIAGVTEEEIRDYLDPLFVKIQIDEVLKKYVDVYDKHDKFIVCGYNVRFDVDFFRKFYIKLSDAFYGAYYWPNTIDVMSLATVVLERYRPQMPNFQLTTVANQFKIPFKEGEAHDAMADIRKTRDIFYKHVVTRIY